MAMEKEDIFKDTFTRWRLSYLRLRVLERNLVTEARAGEDPVRIASLYENVESLREATSALFHVAQTARMPHYIPPERSVGDSTLW